MMMRMDDTSKFGYFACALCLLTAACSSSGSGAAAAGSGGTGAGSGGAGASGGAGGSAAGNANATGGDQGRPTLLTGDASGITGLGDCALAQAGQCIKPLTRSKAEVCQRWASDRPQLATQLQTSIANGCDPGVSDATAINDALRRLNLVRWLGGVSPAALDATWNAYATSCAIIQSYIAPAISHYPDASSPCYTSQGYTASGQSQLAAGSLTPAVAIDDLIFDYGSNNVHILGHRQGMLMPETTTVGIGFVEPSTGVPATCVRTFDGTGITSPGGLTDTYAFPSWGHQPWELVAPATYMAGDAQLEWSVEFPPDVTITGASARLVRRNGSAWQDVPVTSGPLAKAGFNGLWIDPSVFPVEPGTYAMLITGTSLGPIGYQILLEQCDAVPLTCNVLKQECGAGFGCYHPEEPYCRKSQGIAVGQTCTGWDNNECAPGSTCSPDFAGGGSKCSQYCDPNNTTGANACATLCPNLEVDVYSSTTLAVVGAFCEGGSGGSCDPLAQNCAAGQGCFGYDPPQCQTASTIPAGSECSMFGGTCVPGATCVGVRGSDNMYCSPYCDLASSATGPTACATLCPGKFWNYKSFGLCIPPT